MCHLEVGGFLLDYCNRHEIPVTIIVQRIVNMIKLWLDFYQTMFKFDVCTLDNFKADDYQHIFVLSSDDFSIQPMMLSGRYMNHLIAIDHFPRKHGLLYQRRLDITNFPNRPNIPWALPVYQQVPFWIKHTQCSDTTYVVFAGKRNLPSPEFIAKLTSDKPLHIDVVNFHQKPPNKSSNVTYHYQISTFKLMELMLRANYTIITSKCTSMSGIIPIAFGTGVQLIMPKELKHQYNMLQSIMYYEADQNIQLGKPNLSLIYRDLDYLIARRNRIVESILSIPPNQIQIVKSPSKISAINLAEPLKPAAVCLDLSIDQWTVPNQHNYQEVIIVELDKEASATELQERGLPVPDNMPTLKPDSYYDNKQICYLLSYKKGSKTSYSRFRLLKILLSG